MESIKRIQQLSGILTENFDPIDNLIKMDEFKKEDDTVIMAQGIMEDDDSLDVDKATGGQVADIVDTNQNKPTSNYNESIRFEIRSIVKSLLK